MRTVKTSNDYTRDVKADKEQFEHSESTHSLESCLDLAIESMEKRKYLVAIHYLNRSIELSPLTDSRPIRIRAELHIITKQYEEAMADIEYLLWLDPEDEDALNAKQILVKRIDYEKMLSSFPIYS